MVIDMSDYYIGIFVGGLIGYSFALLTVIVLWGLCYIAKGEKDGN